MKQALKITFIKSLEKFSKDIFIVFYPICLKSVKTFTFSTFLTLLHSLHIKHFNSISLKNLNITNHV